MNDQTTNDFVETPVGFVTHEYAGRKMRLTKVSEYTYQGRKYYRTHVYNSIGQRVWGSSDCPADSEYGKRLEKQYGFGAYAPAPGLFDKHDDVEQKKLF